MKKTHLTFCSIWFVTACVFGVLTYESYQAIDTKLSKFSAPVPSKGIKWNVDKGVKSANGLTGIIPNPNHLRDKLSADLTPSYICRLEPMTSLEGTKRLNLSFFGRKLSQPDLIITSPSPPGLSLICIFVLENNLITSALVKRC